MVNPEKRYVRLQFDGYIPAELAVEVHLIRKLNKKNVVGPDLIPYEEFDGEYRWLKQK